MKALIVDDDFVPRMVLQRALEAHGTVDAATNAVEALAAFAFALQQGKPYQLVCLDIEMPDASGHEVLREIRRREVELKVPEESRVRVLMTSGHSEADQVRTAFINRSDGFLVKPVDFARLKALLRKFALIPE
jgi:two-component system chemotaxis response regulator CheY